MKKLAIKIQRIAHITLFIIASFLYSFSVSSHADESVIDKAEFYKWLEEFKSEAVLKGIKASTIEVALKDLVPIEKVVALDKKQPEKGDFNEYKEIVLSKERIENGRKLYRENRKLLEKIGKKYGVQPRFIVALWGIETSYGKNTGDYYVPAALATLAFEGRRRDFFKEELIKALKIIEEGHVSPVDMKGSWAGAMGQSQFMPSSFMNYSVDYNGDGRRDIWQTKSDIFASIANYLSKAGWSKENTWGRKVKLPKNIDTSLLNVKADISNAKTLKEWSKLGVRSAADRILPQKNIKAYIVLPSGEKNDAYLVYDNYKSIMKWNRSLYFATGVGLLSDAINK